MAEPALKDHYERKYAADTAATSIETVAVPADRFQAVVKFFPHHFKSGDILELGCGNGNVAKTFLQSDLDIRSYTLGDISLPRVEGVRHNLEDHRVEVLEIDAEDVPESMHGQFDAVLMSALIEHLVDPLRAMQEIRKLLRPGGLVYIETPNIAKYTRRIRLLTGKFPSTASDNEGLTTFAGKPVDLHEEGHLHYFTFRSLSLMLTDRCGFSHVEKLAYPGGRRPLGLRMHGMLATWRPEVFSELVIVAYA